MKGDGVYDTGKIASEYILNVMIHVIWSVDDTVCTDVGAKKAPGYLAKFGASVILAQHRHSYTIP